MEEFINFIATCLLGFIATALSFLLAKSIPYLGIPLFLGCILLFGAMFYYDYPWKR